MENLNIGNMKNWTHDVPPGSREVFYQILDFINCDSVVSYCGD